jgi:cell division protein FtsZ
VTVLDPKVEVLKYEMQEDAPRRVCIKVVGVGGGGGNAVAHMMSGGLEGVEFYVVNTDTQALAASPVPNKLAIGGKITNGRGAGGDLGQGRQAALDETERLIEMLQGADMVFVAAGLGCGTGTGAAPVIAGLAKQLNAITVAVVTKPFGFEGARPMKQAEKGLAELAATVDTVIAVPNDRLLALAPRGTSVLEAFRMGHDLLRQTVQDMVEIITTPGLVNRDLSDIRATMRGTGYSVMGTALGKGDNAALEAARQAISWPLLEGASIRGARDIFVNITGSSRLGLHEVNEACALIRQAAENEDVQVNFGIVLNEAMGDAVKLTVIATGFPREETCAASDQAWPAPPVAEIPVARPEPPEPPEPAVAMPLPREEPVDPEDWEQPAYVRQGKVLH